MADKAKVKVKDSVNPFAHIEAAKGGKKEEAKKPPWYDWRRYLGSYDSAAKAPPPKKAKKYTYTINPKTGKPERSDVK